MAAKSLREKVYQYAYSHMGKQVKFGECYCLPHRALVKAGAKSAPDYQEVKKKSDKEKKIDKVDYIWGKKISIGKAQAGDILQFKNHSIIITRIKNTTLKFRIKDLPLKKQKKGELEYFAEFKTPLKRGHHSAIVASNKGSVMRIFEQHVMRGTNKIQKTVGDALIYKSNQTLPTKKSKESIKITHSWAKSVSKCYSAKADKVEVAKIKKMFFNQTIQAVVTTTETVKVSGTIHAYQPEKR